MKRDFTATCYVIENDKVLLIYHKKLKKWLPPGGHMDPNELPTEAAKREVLEETGLEIEFIRQENIFLKEPNAQSFERPYMCLLEEIPAFGNTPTHQHIDFIYLGYPIGGKILQHESEISAIRWFTKNEVLDLSMEVDIFKETVDTILQIFSQCAAYRETTI